jgi:hypothetical protein
MCGGTLGMSPTYQNKITSSYKRGSANASELQLSKDEFTSVQDVLHETQYILGNVLSRSVELVLHVVSRS